MAYWVIVDARAHRYRPSFDFGAFLFFAWPLVLPYYLSRARGARGLLFSVAILALAIVPDVVADVILLTVG